MKNLYICTTYYHVYITVLKQLAAPADTDLVVCDDLTGGAALCERLRDAGLFGQVWYVEQNKLPDLPMKTRLNRLSFYHVRRARLLLPLLPFDPRAYDDIYIFHDLTPLGKLLNDIRKPYHLVEDSYDFYRYVLERPQAQLYKPHDLKFFVRKLLNVGYFPLGDSPFLLDVEVNDKNGLQVALPRVREVRRQPLLDRLSEEEKALILRIFACPSFSADPAQTALLLTQPLWEDGVLPSRDAQLALYRQLIDALEAKGWTVLLKPHPRDHVSYDSLGVQTLTSEFPAEMLNYLVPEGFACAAAAFSSAILTIHAAQRYYFKEGALVPAE